MLKAPPIIVGAWSMAVMLWQQFEYYYYYYYYLRAIILVLYILMLYSIMGISTALSAYFTAHSAAFIVSTSLKIRVNVMQSVYLVRSALPYLNSSQGTIVVMSSASGEICMCECMYMCGCMQGGRRRMV